MSHAVFFYQAAAEVPAGADVVLDGDEGHHAASVRRLRPDEPVILTDGRGVALRARTIEVGHREVRFVVDDVDTTAQPRPRVAVVQAIAKGDRGERAVELLTEVGVAQIVPWQAERSVSRWSEEKATRALARWRATAASAAKQSGRVWWPQVAPVHDGPDVVGVIGRATRTFVLHEAAEATLVNELDRDSVPNEAEVALVVGPEGGVSSAELESFGAAGASVVRLGPTVLRTSTAGVVAATLVLARTGEWHATTLDEGADRD